MPTNYAVNAVFDNDSDECRLLDLLDGSIGKAKGRKLIAWCIISNRDRDLLRRRRPMRACRGVGDLTLVLVAELDGGKVRAARSLARRCLSVRLFRRSCPWRRPPPWKLSRHGL